MAFFEAKLRPCLTGSDGGVDLFLDDGCADSTGGFDTLTVLVEAVGSDGLGAVLVCGDSLGGEGGGVVELFVVCPVGATVIGVNNRVEASGKRRAYFASLDISEVFYVFARG